MQRSSLERLPTYPEYIAASATLVALRTAIDPEALRNALPRVTTPNVFNLSRENAFGEVAKTLELFDHFHSKLLRHIKVNIGDSCGSKVIAEYMSQILPEVDFKDGVPRVSNLAIYVFLGLCRMVQKLKPLEYVPHTTSEGLFDIFLSELDKGLELSEKKTFLSDKFGITAEGTRICKVHGCGRMGPVEESGFVLPIEMQERTGIASSETLENLLYSPHILLEKCEKCGVEEVEFKWDVFTTTPEYIMLCIRRTEDKKSMELLVDAPVRIQLVSRGTISYHAKVIIDGSDTAYTVTNSVWTRFRDEEVEKLGESAEVSKRLRGATQLVLLEKDSG
ncbi:uncharacterized protein K452DRAFT_359369 [Aplosporella prunicola CBS 121167]|uniref:Uncharacterized protein n=1 Tax=Aplosporella prunicola CBS 121167 TaxID=1176127 RepID=A0A6A6BAA4_9PEZI|nr:uncharacterized protein K452DRAFT_359369 [Aplosporella prunicola CBS 121167]KAF2140946.1 hypothetical protein K452DRAFT_359369 [Aplosporella prunicola CBS 121167]